MSSSLSSDTSNMCLSLGFPYHCVLQNYSLNISGNFILPLPQESIILKDRSYTAKSTRFRMPFRASALWWLVLGTLEETSQWSSVE